MDLLPSIRRKWIPPRVCVAPCTVLLSICVFSCPLLDAVTCENLTTLALPDATITLAQLVQAGAFTLPAEFGPLNFKSAPATYSTAASPHQPGSSAIGTISNNNYGNGNAFFNLTINFANQRSNAIFVNGGGSVGATTIHDVLINDGSGICVPIASARSNPPTQYRLNNDTAANQVDNGFNPYTRVVGKTGFTTSTVSGITISATGAATVVLSGVSTPVANPTFSPVAGTYTYSQPVAISTTTSGATICYTKDGSTPTTNGAGACTHGITYAGADMISTALTIKAIGSKSGNSDSALATAAYVINLPTDGILSRTRAIDWTYAGVLDANGNSEAHGGGIPVRNTICTTVNAYGQDNRGTVNSSGATMTVTAVTQGTNVDPSWAAVGPPATNRIALELPNSTGSLSGPTPNWVYTANPGSDPLNSGTDWNGKTFTIVHGGTPYTGTIASTTTTTITFTAQPHSIGGALAPVGSGYSSTSGTPISATVISVNTGANTFTLSAVPTAAVSGYIFAGSGDASAITSAFSACPVGQVVQLGAGTFNLLTGINLTGLGGRTLHGAGAHKTIIKTIFPGGGCDGWGPAICFGDVASPIINSAWPNPAGLLLTSAARILPGGSNNAMWTGTAEGGAGVYPQGATHITLTNVGSATIRLNGYISLDQEDVLVSGNGPQNCTRQQGPANGHPPTNCGQEAPVFGRMGFSQGTVTVGGTVACGTGVAVTQTAGSPFITDGTWTNALIIFQTVTSGRVGSPLVFYISQVCDSTHLTLISGPTAASYHYKVGFRGQVQMVKVIGISGAGCSLPYTGAGPCTFTISPGLYATNWDSSFVPAAWFPDRDSMTGSGVENLTIDLNSSVPGQTSTIAFVNANNCWASGVRTIHGNRNHFELQSSPHITLRRNYSYGTAAAARQSYALESDSSSDLLFSTNITQQVNGGIVPQNNQGSVYIYNDDVDNYVTTGGDRTITGTQLTGNVATYTYTGPTLVGFTNFLGVSVAGTSGAPGCAGIFNITYLLYTSATATTFTVPITHADCAFQAENGLLHMANSVMAAGLISHGDGNRYTLGEGNIFIQLFNDTVHGPSSIFTYLRNYISGYEKNRAQNLWAYRGDNLQRGNSWIGNLQGTVGINDIYQQFPGCGATNCGSTTDSKAIFAWTLANTSENSGGGTSIVDADPQGLSSSLRWGNVDTVTGVTNPRWCGNSSDTGWGTTCLFGGVSTSEIPTSGTFGYDNPVPTIGDTGAGQAALPKSFYYSSTPAEFSNCPWAGCPVPFPPIGPDVTGGTAISADLTGATAPGGHAYSTPAQLCYLNSSIDPAYPLGFDRGVLLFDPAACYSSTTPTAQQPTFSPLPGTFSQNISLSTATGGAVICYRTDGGTPAATVAGTCDGTPTHRLRRNAQQKKASHSDQESSYAVGDRVKVNLHTGRIVEATVKAVIERTDGKRLQVDFGKDETALVHLWQRWASYSELVTHRAQSPGFLTCSPPLKRRRKPASVNCHLSVGRVEEGRFE